jgi:simple sugar transport system permease protein
VTTTIEPPVSPPAAPRRPVDWLGLVRAALPTVGRWAAALTGALVIFSALIMLRGADPLTVFPDLIVSTFAHPRPVSQIFIIMAPLVLAALAVVVPARAGMANVGGEGQVMLGAIAAAGVGLWLDTSMPGTVVLVLMILAGMLAGAAWAGIAGLLRLVFKVNEAVTTLLLNFVAIDLLSFLIYQSWRESNAGQPTTRELDPGARLPLIPGTEVTIGVIIAVLATVIIFLLLRTPDGGSGSPSSGGTRRRRAGRGCRLRSCCSPRCSWAAPSLDSRASLSSPASRTSCAPASEPRSAT